MTEATEPGPISEKWFLKSKTIWGILIAAVPGLLQAVGVDFGGEETVGAAEDAFQNLLRVFDMFNEAAGAALAWWGRVSAKGGIVHKIKGA